MAIKIALITDLHISVDETRVGEVDTQKQFVQVLEKAAATQPDLIVLAGDLCQMEGNIETYQWIKTKMDKARIEYKVIAGNHDNSDMMIQMFGQNDAVMTQNEYYYLIKIQERRLIFLDTSKAAMSVEQFHWFREQIELTTTDEIIVFMHHPPLFGDSKHMEPNYAFRQMDEFQALCACYPSRNFVVFCGHYHINRTITLKNITVHISPSTCFQIDPDSIEFKLGNGKIGYRNIMVTKEYGVWTDVREI